MAVVVTHMLAQVLMRTPARPPLAALAATCCNAPDKYGMRCPSQHGKRGVYLSWGVWHCSTAAVDVRRTVGGTACSKAAW